MRSWFFMALLISTPFSVLAKEGTSIENRDVKKGPISKENAEVEPREFRVAFEFEVVQQEKDGDFVMEGKTIPGRSVDRTRAALELSNDELFAAPHSRKFMETTDRKCSQDRWFEIKVTSLRKDQVRLLIIAKQSRKEVVEAGASRSWNLSFEATKTARLGERIKLEFGDEKILGTKCTFEGLIEERASDKK
jgi:hypothetical protein